MVLVYFQYIWGDEGLKKYLSFLYDEFDNYEPNDDVILWIKNMLFYIQNKVTRSNNY
ncbi:hypothetical protein ACDX78_20420 [Virgibacillus oceani]